MRPPSARADRLAAQQADYLAVPLLSGHPAVVQVIEVLEDGTLICGLSSRRTPDTGDITPLSPSEVTAVVKTTPASVASGHWPVVGFDQIPRLRSILETGLHGGWAEVLGDAVTHDPAVVEGYLNAWHGLYPWDAFGDLFETIKRPEIERPT